MSSAQESNSSQHSQQNSSKRKKLSEIMVGFLGGGRMAQALAKGFISSGLVRARNIMVSDKNLQMSQMFEDIGVNVTQNNKEVVANSDLVMIAVKPNVVKRVLEEIAPVVNPQKQLFVSIAAGVTTKAIEQYLPEGTRVVRVMPNTPSLVQAGASVMAPGTHAIDADAEVVQELLSTIGICEESPENLLDAVTGVSGSGPAYAYAAIEALSDGGVKMGLPRDLAIKLAAQTMLGASKMVLETGKHPGQLKDEVCSPNGTTITAMHVLEQRGFRGIIMDAVEAAVTRARELGASNN